MNTKQRARYIKSHFTDELKNKILARDGIEIDESKKLTHSSLICTRCNYVNAIDVQLCSKCGYIISQEYLNKVKEEQSGEMKETREELLESKRRIDELFEYLQYSGLKSK
jgi:ribosomal protein L40E